MKPKISLIGPSHRTHLWKTFYESIITNLDFEVVFVTDIEPKQEEDPSQILTISSGKETTTYYRKNDRSNFKWIFSKVKPAQCNDIAYRHTTGDVIIYTADDILYSPYALDHAYNMWKSFYDKRVITVIRFFEDGKEATQWHHFPENDKIQSACSPLISREAIEEAGGLADRNFICGHWDTDLILRIRQNGGRIFTCPLACAYEPHLKFHEKEANFATIWEEERSYLMQLWTINSDLTVKRNKPFEAFDKKDILIKSQGPSGKWI